MRSMAHQIQYTPQQNFNSPLPIYQQQHLINSNIYRGYNQIPLSHSMIDPRVYQTNPSIKLNFSNLQHSRVQANNKEYKLQETKFPFGKDHAKIAKYVQDQLGKDEENRKMLEKFRQDAINYRNNRRSNGIGKAVYTTQSMNPGSSNNPIVKNLQKINIPNRINTEIVNPNQYYIYRPVYPYYQPQRVIQESPIRYQTISLKRQFSKKDYKKKLKQKIRLQELRQKSQQKWDQLQTMIAKVNSQLKKNSRLISQNMSKSHAKSTIASKEKNTKISNKKKSIYYQTFHSQQTQPAIQYSKSITSINPQKQKIKDIKKHLDLLKRHKKRLQSINQAL